jgi:GTP-binding protein YchF
MQQCRGWFPCRQPSSSLFLGQQCPSLLRQQSSYSSKHNNYSAIAMAMRIKIGIVGKPNIGKSTLFNAIAQQSIAQASNFPFCTIDPNVAKVPMPDLYLEKLGQFAGSTKTLPAALELIDVAGLVAGASRGEGLGNRFLATIRECNAICHLVRQFEDPNIVHVDGRVSALEDAEVVNLELVLADIAHIERRLEKTTCQGLERETLQKLLPELQKGVPSRSVGLSAEAELSVRSMGLLTLKPVLYLLNVDEVDFLLAHDATIRTAQKLIDKLQYRDPARDLVAVVSAKLEAEIGALGDWAEQQSYLEEMGVDTSSTNDEGAMHDRLCYRMVPNLIRQLLDLMLVYTGPGVPATTSQTTKAYLYAAANAPTAYQLAGRLHGEIQSGFIRAEVTPSAELLRYESYVGAKDAGVIRTEGKDAMLQDYDVILIKWK